MMQGDAGKCKGCGADIIWAITTKGRRIPLDARSEKRFVGGLNVELTDTYQSHFATCPKASDFRKGKADD